MIRPAEGWVRILLLCVLGTIGFVVLLGLPRARDRIEWRADVGRLAEGMLLEATPRLRDGIFDGTSILIIAHGEEGTMGLILAPAHDEGPLRDGRPAAAAAGLPAERLGWGGPVAPEHVFLLSPTGHEGWVEVVPGVFVQRTDDSAFAAAHLASDPDLRALVGRAGWRPEQLAAEVRLGAWRVRRTTAEGVFGLLSAAAL
jgi:putative transcriptional regulator